jgi:hypothetical protein
LAVYSSTGQIIAEMNIDNNSELVLSVAGWDKGIYYYRFTTDGEASSSGKLIVY